MRNYYEEVRRILVNHPRSRDDDMLLYAIFCFDNRYVKANETFYDVMKTAKSRCIPSYESVTRARRKVQETEPSLRGERYKGRKDEQEMFREYYGNH